MVNIADNILDLIGGTPLVRLNRVIDDVSASIIAKLEFMNPGGSLKDRIAKNMIEAAQSDGDLLTGQSIVAAVRPDKQSEHKGIIIEPTGGNTGVSLALVAAAKGYKLKLAMPDTVSTERKNLLKAYGADLIFTEGGSGMGGAVKKAEELELEDSNYFMPQQFKNPANPEAHKITAKEIWDDTDGLVDVVVCGVGTGGTITGIAEYLKAKNPDILMVAVEPSESAVISGEEPMPHGIAGLGAGFIPPILKKQFVDETIKISTNDAFIFTKRLANEEGILAGISSGAVLCGGLQVAKREENKDKMIVLILPDSGERYLDKPVFNDS